MTTKHATGADANPWDQYEPERARLSVTISAALRHDLELARENSDATTASIYKRHTLSAEVEELLRIGLKVRASANVLTLRLDSGLWAWLKAYCTGASFYGSMEDTAIAFIRNEIMTATKSDRVRAAIHPHLPPHVQRIYHADAPKVSP